MAKPIKETPELKGKEAKRFVAMIDNPRTVSAKEVADARQAYEAMMSIAKFNFWNGTDWLRIYTSERGYRH